MYAIAPQLHRPFKDPIPFRIALLRGARRDAAAARSGRAVVVSAAKKDVEVRAATLTRDICVVRSRDEADSLRRAHIVIAGRVRALLQGVRVEVVFVVHDVVVRALDLTLQSFVSL